MTNYAVVTGAARGIGLAISKALLKDGFDVFGLDNMGLIIAEIELDAEDETFIKPDCL